MSKKKLKKSLEDPNTNVKKKLNDFMVLGVKRQEFRGDGKTLKEDYIKASNAETAMDKFNDKHRDYKAASVRKLEMDDSK